MNHVKYLVEKTSCGKEEAWIQCQDGNIPLPLLLIGNYKYNLFIFPERN